jgi:S-adenosylmethionine-diacylglycerol 3-amino-3-carboxypropyl transferase
MSEAAGTLSQGGIRYSQVWEDHALLEQGLRIGPDDDVLSITSAGDNVLALLLCEPRSVTAVDLNPAQQAMLELKLAAIRRLDHAAFACLCGAREGFDRAALYREIRADLSEPACAFWDAQPITNGLLDCGRLERYIGKFHHEYLRRLVPADAIARLLGAPDPAAQSDIFAREIATPHFERALRGFFGREELAREGRTPEQFRFVEHVDVGAHFWNRFRYACTELPLRGNFYLEYAFTWRYADLETGPPYLRPSQFAKLRTLVDRVRIATGELGTFLVPGAFSKANLSDIFEYMSEETSAALMGTLARSLRKGGRFAYWNLLVPRESPPALRDRLRPLPNAHELWQRDRSWFYSAFHVEEVIA